VATSTKFQRARYADNGNDGFQNRAVDTAVERSVFPMMVQRFRLQMSSSNFTTKTGRFRYEA
jgi:hypothetical protein